MSDKPKIIVDGDWKERVQAEKEALAAGEPEAQSSGAESEASGPIPPASFPMLVTSLATQAAIELGQIPNPVDEKSTVRPELAKHHIDMLGVLEEKTSGNLTTEEAKMLTGVLHDLRMMFVAVSKQQQTGSDKA
jgi:hypothetical protein